MSVNTNAGILQTLDYKYHIRGGLKGINLDANNNLTNSLFSYKLTYEEDGTYYDGNIRNQYWKSNIDGIQRAFQYTYDGASRITAAAYGSTKAGENYALNNVNYDANGNILSLSRNGATNTNYTSFGNVDNLSYTYQTNSNKLLKIQDATIGNPDLGDFRDGNITGNDYDYYADGSLKKDLNKGIDSIKYNYLKLVNRIKFSNGTWVNYQYDANGKKIKKVTSQGITTDYIANKIYENGNLYQTSHDEGRIVNGIYEYNITDHLGNLRVSLKDSAGIAVPLQSLFYDPWGLSMKGMQINKNYANFNKHQYNGKELQLETGWNDFGARMYGAAEGRWFVQDPLAHEYFGISPYVYVLNRPTIAIDPDGRRVYFVGGAGNDADGWNYINRWGQAFQNAGIDFYRVNASHGKIGDMSFTNFYRASGMEADYTFKSVPAGGGLYAEYNGEVPVDNKMINSTAKLYKQQLKDNPLEEGEQFNLAGYSYGSVLQAQTALKLANDGQVIDNLVLIGSPISDRSDLWKQLNSNKNIKNVIRYDLKGDLLSNPQDILDFIGGAAQNRNDAGPHFDAARPGQQANQLIQTIVQWLQQQGVKN